MANESLERRLQRLGERPVASAGPLIDDVVRRGMQIGRRRRRRSLIAGCLVACALVGILGVTRLAMRDDGGRDPLSGVPLQVTVVEGGPVRTAQVTLDPIPPGYAPSIDSDHALALAKAQLSESSRATSIEMYLGELSAGPDHGVVWVAVFKGICTPIVGPSPLPGQSVQGGCAEGSISVVLNADDGSLIVIG